MAAQNDFPLTPEEFNDIYSRVPRLCVDIVIRDSRGVLLAKRDIEPCKGQWHLPGGTVYFGEPLTDAVRRVAARELGVTVDVETLLGYIEYPRMAAAGYRGWPVGIAFAATITGGQLRGSDQGAEIGFFPEIPADTIAEQAEFLRQSVLVSQ